MRVRFLTLAAVLCTTGAFGERFARAQPDVGAPAIAPNPANVTPEQRRQQAMDQAANIIKMTPEQQKEALRKMLEQSLRSQLGRNGLPDAKGQSAVIECVSLQEKERDKVRVEAAKIFKLSQLQADSKGDANATALLNGYLAAVDDAKVQREAATQKLDAQIDFTHKPQLMAFLTLMGIIGDASWYTGDLQLVGNMSVGTLALAGNITR